MPIDDDQSVSDLLLNLEHRLAQQRSDLDLAATRVVESLRHCLDSQMVIDSAKVLESAGLPGKPEPTTEQQRRVAEATTLKRRVQRDLAQLLLRCASDMMNFANLVRGEGNELASRYPRTIADFLLVLLC